MLKTIFSLFSELIFTRQEEYDPRSKHFKLAKVIFAGLIVLIFIYSFFVTSAFFRVGVKYMKLHEQHQAQLTACQKVPDKNQPQGSSDSLKTQLGNKE